MPPRSSKRKVHTAGGQFPEVHEPLGLTKYTLSRQLFLYEHVSSSGERVSFNNDTRSEYQRTYELRKDE